VPSAADILAQYDQEQAFAPAETVNVRTPEGDTLAIPASAVDYAREQGFTVEDSAMEAERIAREVREERYSGAGNTITAGMLGLARGATLGLSDVVLTAGDDAMAEELRGLKEANPTLSTVTEVAGAVLPAFASGGASTASRILGATPAGMAARAERALTGAGAASGFVGKTAYAAAGGAVEGALAGAGSYLSSVALDNADLSAEAFMGAMGKGAMWGGGIGAGTAAAERGFVAARRLFPSSEVTRESVVAAEEGVNQAVGEALSGGDELLAAARRQLDEHRMRIAAAGAAAKESDLAAKQEINRLRVEREQLRNDRLKAKTGEAPIASAPTTDLPKGWQRGPHVAADAPVYSGAPKYDAIDEDALYVVKPEELSGATGLPGFDQGRADVVADAMARGRTVEPIQIAVSPTGRLDIVDGRHRIANAQKSGEPLVVRYSRGAEIGENADKAIDDIAATADEGADTLLTAARKYEAASEKAAQFMGREGVQDWLAKYKRSGRSIEDSFGGTSKGISPRATDRVERFGDDVADEVADNGRSVVRELDSSGRVLTSYDEATGEVLKERIRTGSTASGGDIFTDVKGSGSGYGERLARKILDGGTPSPARAGADDVARADDAAVAAASTRKAAKGSKAKRSVASEILDSAGGDDLEQRLLAMKRGIDEGASLADLAAIRNGRLVDDTNEAIQALGDLDRATHDLTIALGPAAPPSAQKAAAEYAEAIAQQNESLAAQTARALDDTHAAEQAAQLGVKTRTVKDQLDEVRVQKARDDAATKAELNRLKVQEARAKAAARESKASSAAEEAADETPKSRTGRLVGRAADAAAALEVLQTVGIPGVPDLDKLPVVGPLLGAYLKFRAGKAVWSRLGGKVPASTEARVASKAAEMRDRAAKAIDKALEVGARGARGAARVSIPAAITVLNSSLFDDGERKPRAPKQNGPVKPTIREVIARRGDELIRAATNEDIVRRTVRRQVPLSNAKVAEALEKAVLRKVQFLYDKLPKDPREPNPFRKADDWTPDPVEVDRFARYVHAAEDPGAVLDRIATGQILPEEAETLKAVYPELFAEVQKRLMVRASETGTASDLPFERRVVLSQLFEVPVDDSMRPEYLAYLQSTYEPTASDPATAGAPPGAAPPTPTISASVAKLSTDTMTALDRRAAR